MGRMADARNKIGFVCRAKPDIAENFLKIASA
jgi:hypothetical protein